jgi:hypothetical protein
MLRGLLSVRVLAQSSTLLRAAQGKVKCTIDAFTASCLVKANVTNNLISDFVIDINNCAMYVDLARRKIPSYFSACKMAQPPRVIKHRRNDDNVQGISDQSCLLANTNMVALGQCLILACGYTVQF